MATGKAATATAPHHEQTAGYIVNLGKSLKMNSKDLDEEALKAFGSKLAYLTVKDASAFIDHLKQKSA